MFKLSLMIGPKNMRNHKFWSSFKTTVEKGFYLSVHLVAVRELLIMSRDLRHRMELSWPFAEPLSQRAIINLKISNDNLAQQA